MELCVQFISFDMRLVCKGNVLHVEAATHISTPPPFE